MPDQIFCTSCGTANTAGARFCYKCGQPIMAGVAVPAARPQSDFITLACPNCGGKLEITPDMERFACKYCGNEHLVRRNGGVVSLAPVIEGLKRVEGKFDQVLTGSDRIAAEQTIQRLKEEILEVEKQAAEKELFIRDNGPAVNALVGPIIFLSIGGLSLPCSLVVFATVDTDYAGWIVLGEGVFCLLVGLISLLAQLNSKKRRQVSQVKAELARLQADLQRRRQEMERLHRYTAER